MNSRIKKIRIDSGLTQQQFADRLGIKRGAIANYEIGRNAPIDAVISLICDKFNVNKDWLLNGTGSPYVEIDKENQLMMWAGSVLKEESESFRKRFVNMLMELDEGDWESLEKMCLLLSKKD